VEPRVRSRDSGPRPWRAAAVGAAWLACWGIAPPPGAAPSQGVQVKTIQIRGETAEEDDRVTVTWRGLVRNTGAETVRVPVRLVARDRQWKPLAYLVVPAVEAAPGSPVEQEAVFELEEALWKRVYAVDPQVTEEGIPR